MSLAVKLKREAKRKKKGRIALRRTIRKSLSYGGSMYSTVHQSKAKKKPKKLKKLKKKAGAEKAGAQKAGAQKSGAQKAGAGDDCTGPVC